MKVRLVIKDSTKENILEKTVYQVSYEMQIMRNHDMKSEMSNSILRTVYEPVLFPIMSSRQLLIAALKDDVG